MANKPSNLKKPFIPKDKPKSWVIYILSGLSGLFVGAPVIILGKLTKIEFIEKFGVLLFILCWSVAVIMWVVYIISLLSGRYSALGYKDWKDQLW